MKQIVNTGKGPIECRIVGEGKPVIVLNGMHTNCDSLVGSERFFLERGYQLIVLSRPGYGQTPSRTGRTAEAFADVIVCVLDVLHLERVVVLAISGGGWTALQFAQRHPERVSALILQAAVAHAWPSWDVALAGYCLFNPLVEPLTWGAYRLLARLAPIVALASMFRGISKLKPEVVLDAMSSEQRRDALSFLVSSRSGFGFVNDMRHKGGDLSRIAAPTLVIGSPYDKGVDISHAVFAAQRIPHASLCMVPCESHLLWFSSHNEEIEERMQAFLESSVDGDKVRTYEI